MDIRRKVKNVVYKYSEPERLVREATSNDPWGPTSTVMSVIADMTHDLYAFEMIMPIIWKRLNDKGKNWRHVYKCLVLLDYLIKCGDERVSTACISNIHAIETLKDFQFFEEHKDHGLCVREKSKSLVNLLRDDETLSLERKKGKKVKEKFQGTTSALGSHQRRRPGELGKEIRRQLDREEFNKPVMKLHFDESKSDKEDEDLQRAIALSKAEHEESMKKKQEEERREDLKIKMAMEQSRKEEEALAVLRLPPKTSDTLASLDLLNISANDAPQRNSIYRLSEASRGFDERNGFEDLNQINQSDPWGSPGTDKVTTNISLDFDPWKNDSNFDVTPIGYKSIDNSGWPKKDSEKDRRIIDDIFGDEKPGIYFDSDWNSGSKTPPFSASKDKDNQLLDMWLESPEDNFHNSKKMTGSLASLTDIGLSHQEEKMQHSVSVMNLAENRKKKTAQDFLGENAKLVNLENLLPTPKSGVYRDNLSYAQKNPFGVSSGLTSNPFSNQPVQIKKPMNAIATPGSQNTMFSSSGNLNSNNVNNNFSNFFSQMPQPVMPSSQSQYQGFAPVIGNPYNSGAVPWGQQSNVAPQYQWVAQTNIAAPNPFYN